MASGTFAPAASASPWSDSENPSRAANDINFAPVPPPADGARPDLSGEPPADEGGSITAETMDPWADAHKEGSAITVSRLPAGPEYPIVLNAEIEFFLDLFTGRRRELVSLWAGRSGRYLPMMREVMRARGLPEDLVYTAMIESGFNPTAVSRAGAKGMWQFMAPTARRYGLRVDQWVDERYDPEKATVAAAAYLRDLHSLFGSWELAQAAYNAGEVKVARAIRATGTNDFWAIARTKYLRRETKDFVPQIHAATLLGRDPDRYGIEFGEPPSVSVETVTVPASTDLRRLAATIGVSPATLRSLNAVLVRQVTPPGRSWTITVPSGMRETVLTALAPKPKKPASAVAGVSRAVPVRAVAARRGDDVHVVRPRDTVSTIARRYGVSVTDVLRWNRLDQHDRIRPGDRLRVADSRPSVADRDGQGGFR